MQVQSANICQLSENIVANQLIYNYKDQQSRTASNATINHQSAMIDCQEKHRKKCCMSICVGCRFLVWHHLGQNVEILWVSEQEQFMVQAMPHFAASDFDSRCQCNKTLRGPQYIQYITRYWWVGIWIYLSTLPLQTSSERVALSVCIKRASYTEDCKNVCSLSKAVLDNRLELARKKLQARSLFTTLQRKLEKRKKNPSLMFIS